MMMPLSEIRKGEKNKPLEMLGLRNDMSLSLEVLHLRHLLDSIFKNIYLFGCVWS